MAVHRFTVGRTSDYQVQSAANFHVSLGTANVSMMRLIVHDDDGDASFGDDGGTRSPLQLWVCWQSCA